MAERTVYLENDTQCPYCGTMVMAGDCMCPSCGAEYGVYYSEFLTPAILFVVGALLGSAIYKPAAGWVGILLAMFGSMWIKDYLDKNPTWKRGTW